MFTAQPHRRWAPSKLLTLLFVACLAVSSASVAATAQAVGRSGHRLNRSGHRHNRSGHRLNRSGHRLNRSGHRLSRLARGTHARRASYASALSAPKLTVSGQTLSWTRPGGAKQFVFVRKAPGQADQYSVIDGTSTTPPPVPGYTVRYSVRTNVSGSAWAPEKSISYPALTLVVEQSPTTSSETTSAPTTTTTSTSTTSTTTTTSTETTTTTTPSAPVLSVSGETVSWAPLPGVTSYTLAIVRNPATTRETTYQQVTGTSVTPPAVPGQTVNYGLAARTPVGGPWAKEVSITYPSTTTTTPPAPPVEEPAPAPESGGFGLPFVKGVDANLRGWGVNNLPEIASEMSSLGVNWSREDLAWESVEAQKGVFNWTRFDETVTAAKARGITILPIVGYAPSWASPTDATAYAEFVAAAVKRYGPGTSANLQWWELWNEPYFAYAWSGHTPEPEAYARDVVAAAQAARGIAPTIKLLVSADYQESAQTGGITTEQKTWVDSMFAAEPELGKWIDGVSMHPYGGDPANPLKEKGGYLDTTGVWGFARIDTVREKFLAHNVDIPFWITEEGWSTWDNSEETVTKRYRDLFPAIKARPWIRALFPFGLREGTSHPTNDQAGYGLLRFGTWEPKPSWSVIQEGFKTLS